MLNFSDFVEINWRFFPALFRIEEASHNADPDPHHKIVPSCVPSVLCLAPLTHLTHFLPSHPWFLGCTCHTFLYVSLSSYFSVCFASPLPFLALPPPPSLSSPSPLPPPFPRPPPSPPPHPDVYLMKPHLLIGALARVPGVLYYFWVVLNYPPKKYLFCGEEKGWEKVCW